MRSPHGTKHFLSRVGSAFLAMAICHGATGFAREPLLVMPYWHTPAPYYTGNPRVIDPATVKNPTPSPAKIPQKYAPPAPSPKAYPYGFFGAQTRGFKMTKQGYYGEYDQTTYSR